MDAFSLEPPHEPELLNVRFLLGEAIRRQHQHLTQRALLDAVPAWLAADEPRCGAPDYFWARFTARLSPQGIETLLAHPDWLAELLVEAWRRWRTPWIAGEWQA
jgi:hypothetical protein